MVYVNRNASRADPGTVVGPEDPRLPAAATPAIGASPARQQPSPPRRPNNIFERLAQIDREHAEQRAQGAHPDSPVEVPQKKLSLGKRKLALLDKKKVSKKAAAPTSVSTSISSREAQHEPLLALS